MAFPVKEIKDEAELRRIAVELYRLSDFNSNTAANRINSTVYSKGSVKQMHSRVRSYLNSGTKSSKLHKIVYAILDEARAKHVQKLVPSESDRAREYKAREFKPKAPVVTSKIVDDISQNMTKIDIKPSTMEAIKSNTEGKITETLGLMSENNILMCPSIDWANGYMEAFKQMGHDIQFQIVKTKVYSV